MFKPGNNWTAHQNHCLGIAAAPAEGYELCLIKKEDPEDHILSSDTNPLPLEVKIDIRKDNLDWTIPGGTGPPKKVYEMVEISQAKV